MKLPKVSIVIPVYNGEGFIRECMDSVLNQTLSDIEIIPVDAGSTDGTLQILEEYALQDSRINLLHSEKKSMGYQYNMGISESTGEYIGFLEADDYIAKTMLERLYQIAKENNEADYIKSAFDMFIDKEERLFLNYDILGKANSELYNQTIRPSDYPEMIFRDVNMWNGIYKREFIIDNAICLNETDKAAFQDIGFVIQTFLNAEHVMYVREDSYKYRRDNIHSSVYDQKSLIFVVQEFKYITQIINRMPKKNNRFVAVIAKRFLNLFCGYYNKLPKLNEFTDDIKKAINEFKQLFRELYIKIEYRDLVMEGLNNSMSCWMLLENNLGFDEFRRNIVRTDKQCFQSFFNYVRQHDRTIIFGAGECGACVYGMLRRNDYHGVIAFCDNDESKCGTEFMGVSVWSLSRAISEEDVLFIIANHAHYREMHRQLRQMGVKDSNICKAVSTIPHLAFEMEISI